MTTNQPKQCHFLREWRIKRGLNQGDLAKRVGTLKSVISRYETGERGISLEMQWKLFEALDIVPGQFFADPDEPSLDGAAKGQPLEVRKLLEKQIRGWLPKPDDEPAT